MEFAVFLNGYTPGPAAHDTELEHTELMRELEYSIKADKHNWKYVWLGEHHALTEYSHLSAPEVMIGYLAAKTERIHIGTAINSLSPRKEHPVRYAERAAMMDHVTQRRFEWGTGRGAGSHEMATFNILDKDSTKPEWNEVVREIPRMWELEDYEHHGETFTVPYPHNVLPKPYVKPHPPLWVAAGNPGTFEKAAKMGIEKVELDDLLARADFITLHVPLTDSTRNILSAENLKKTRKGVRIINCARGGLVDEAALAELLKSGHVAGAAFDVFAVEPATENPLFGLPNVVCTPHLGAATTEAQENVALQVAEQMSDYLLTGAVTNAINMPSVTAEEAKVMGPWLKLAGHLGAFIGQMTDEPIKAINILYDGSVAKMNLEALNCAVIAGIMKRVNPDVNMVSAPVFAKERGIQISTTNQDKSGAFDGYIKVTVVTGKRERSIAGTVFSDGKPRFIQIKGINIDAEVGAHMLYTTNADMPGIIGTLGQTMGENGVNIANFTLGRADKGGEAIALLYVDEEVPVAVREKLAATGMFRQIKPLEFDVA